VKDSDAPGKGMWELPTQPAHWSMADLLLDMGVIVTPGGRKSPFPID